MSTILNALYKETQNPAYSTADQQRKSNRHWKIAFFISVLLIIALLSCLLFVLLNPPQLAAQQSSQAENVLQLAPDEKPLPAAHSVPQKTALVKPVSRVLFVTRPLSASASQSTGEDMDMADGDSAAQAPLVLSAEIKQPQQAALAVANETQPDIDYSNVSAELQQRFERALSMNAQQAKAFIDSENNDGSDIYQMASDFQERVPALSYDFHVYSSLADERWIRVNGEDLKEGQFDRSGKIEVLEIQPQSTVFRLGSQSFSLQSLTDWQGRAP